MTSAPIPASAREEALRLWPIEVDDVDEGVSNGLKRHGFMVGAEWKRTQADALWRAAFEIADATLTLDHYMRGHVSLPGDLYEALCEAVQARLPAPEEEAG